MMKFRVRALSSCGFLASILLLVVQSTSGQAATKKTRKVPEPIEPREPSALRAGFQAGVNISRYSLAPADPYAGVRTGFILGGQLEIPIKGLLFFQPEIRVEQKGYSTDFGLTGSARIDAALTITTLELPLLAKLRFLEGASVSPFFMMGPDLMFRLGGSFSGTDATGRDLILTPSFESMQIRSFALGWDVAGGAEFELSAETWYFGQIRYSIGLTNETDGAQSEKLYRGLQLLTGLNFRL